MKDAPIPVGSSTLSILDGKLAIDSNEVLTATASADNAIDVTTHSLGVINCLDISDQKEA